MKILWLTPEFPCLRSGGQVRQFHLLRHLSRQHQVAVVSLFRPEEDGEVAALAALGVDVVTDRFQPALASCRVRSWLRFLFDSRPHLAHVYPLARLAPRVREIVPVFQPDLIHLEGLFTSELQKVVPGLPVVLDAQNVESVNLGRQQQQLTSPGRRLTSRLDLEKLKRWERKWLCRSTGCVAVSAEDAARLRRLAPRTPIYLVPNGVDVPAFAPPVAHPARQGLLFFGALGYAPNGEGLLYFCQKILPAIRATCPEVILTIIGRNAPAAIAALAGFPGVRYRGFVADVRPYLWRAAVCVVPLLAGGGTRLKILEALAAGCPVVSTRVGAEGLPLRPERELLLADDAQIFAEQVVRLLTQPALAAGMATAGRERALMYDWAHIAPRLERAYQATLERKQAAFCGKLAPGGK